MPDTTGKGGKRGKVWTGERRSGPVPARHIPWPEVFKHHISVCEGHLKMMEMIQKHTTQGSGNYDSITIIVKRSHEMLRQAKDSSRAFVPPPNQREMVPLGSSSESMYPGYSPADIEYGKAATEVGKAIGDMRAQGLKWELPTNGPEYQVGQAHGAKRKLLYKKDRTESTGSEGAAKAASAEPVKSAEPIKDGEGSENPYFIIDTEPTPVALPEQSNKSALETGDEVTKKNEKKKKKKSQEENEEEVVIQTEDMSAEVEARLKAKEERARSKEEKKRKRESAGDEGEKVVKKSKKDKSKKRQVEEDAEGSGDGEGKKKKRKKNKDVE